MRDLPGPHVPLPEGELTLEYGESAWASLAQHDPEVAAAELPGEFRNLTTTVATL